MNDRDEADAEPLDKEAWDHIIFLASVGKITTDTLVQIIVSQSSLATEESSLL